MRPIRYASARAPPADGAGERDSGARRARPFRTSGARQPRLVAARDAVLPKAEPRGVGKGSRSAVLADHRRDRNARPGFRADLRTAWAQSCADQPGAARHYRSEFGGGSAGEAWAL